jgi:hypothetical protein
MSEQTFKSPNFYEREIDLSAPRITGPVGVPAGVIGTSNKGPAFVPVTVANFNEFVQVFGNLDPMHFGPYAVNEFLKNKTALTYTRVLGAGANSTDSDVTDTVVKGTVKNAGFLRQGEEGASDKRHLGSVQFLAAKHNLGAHEGTSVGYFSDNDSLSGNTVNLIRGMLMTPDTARISVYGDSTVPSSFGLSVNDNAAMGASGKFKLVISSTLGASFSSSDGIAGLKILTASFDPSDKDYFGKILNTDPDKFVQEQHYLHADFAVDHAVAYVAPTNVIAVLSGSSNTSNTSGDTSLTFREIFGSYNTRFTSPKTSYFISQPFGTTEHDLFKFEALDDGEYANRLYKISITNVKASANDAYKYGTFNVQIRDWNDTDMTPVVIEQFTNCSLDPDSSNYIAKLIGDRKVFYNFDTATLSEKRIVATGKYPNNSSYVRVVMSDAVEKGQVPSNALPFGFRGPELVNINPNLKSSDDLSPSDSRLAGQLSAAALALSASFLPPVPHRFKVTRGEVTGSQFLGHPGPAEQASPSLYWGVKFERNSTSSDPSANDKTVLNANVLNEKNNLLASYTKFVGISKLDALVTGSSVDSLNNNKFSLAKVAFFNGAIADLTSSVNDHMKETAYIRNAVPDTTTYTVVDPLSSANRITFATLLSQGTYAQFNRFSTFTKFTNFMYGGFDGTNFLNRDARRLNEKSVSFDSPGLAATGVSPAGFNNDPSGDGVDNNGVNSYLTAVDIMTNPMESNNNLLAIPGIREPYISDQAIKKVKDYGLSMYVMDIPSIDDSQSRLYDDSTLKANIKNTAAAFDGRAIDNDYAAAYFPDVFIDDATNRRKVKVPASVAALGALGFNDRVSYPWFAPAGFNRAALDFVSNVDVRLNVSDRDRLYESRINPIATFPRLGYVIYGQKTLKINKSALDRVNVRRLMLELKRIIIGIAQKIVFEQNTPAVRNKFVSDASFQLGLVQLQAGIEAFQVIMNESNNTQDDVDLNRLNGRIVVVPTRVVEYIAIDFIITNSGVQFV